MTRPPSRLRKRLTYRSYGGATLAQHTEHWRGFEWEAGPVVVTSSGPWGDVQCWAASEAEGRRVIRHAAAIGGFDPDNDSGAQWLVAVASGGRNGRRGRMGVQELRDSLGVTMRPGPSGAPLTLAPVP